MARFSYDAITVDSEGDKKQKAMQMAFYNIRISLHKNKFIGFHGDFVWLV